MTNACKILTRQTAMKAITRTSDGILLADSLIEQNLELKTKPPKKGGFASLDS